MKKTAINTTNSLNERIFSREFSKEDISIFSEFFSGRKDLFAEEIFDESNKNLNIIVKNQALDDIILSKHLKGLKSIYYYPIDADLTVNAIIIHYIFDTTHSNNQTEISPKKILINLVSDGAFLLKEYDIAAYPEKYSDFALRLWIFLDKRIHFLKAREISKALADIMSPSLISCQMRPCLLTSPEALNWTEKPMPLPLGNISGANDKRLFFDPETKDFYPDQIAFLHRIRKNSLIKIKEFIRCITSPNIIKKTKNTQKIDILRENCKIIDYLINKSNSGRNFNENEKKTLYYTISFLDNEKNSLRNILMKCPDFKQNTFKKQIANLYPRPISCPKIRELLPEIVNALDCNCIFNKADIELGRYPSPVLHVEPMLVPANDERYTSDFSTPKEISLKYLALLQEIEAMQRQKQILSEELKSSLIKNNKNHIKVNEFKIILENNEIKIETETGGKSI